MSKQVKIGLVTVTYNSAEVIPGFMESLQAQGYQNWLLIAVDNKSRDSSVNLLQNYNESRVLIIENKENLGVAAGNNQGIQKSIESGCDYVVLINNDTEFGVNLLSDLLRNICDLKCDMVVPKMYYFEPKNRLWFAGGSFRKLLFWQINHFGLDQTDSGKFDNVKPITYAPTCCVIMPVGLFKKVGFMDEQYFVYYDDVDFFIRANRANCLTYYVPQIEIFHKVSSLSGGSESEFGLYMQSRNSILFLRKNYPNFLSMIGTIGQFIYFILRKLFKKDTSKVYAVRNRGFWDGLKMGIKRRVTQ